MSYQNSREQQKQYLLNASVLDETANQTVFYDGDGISFEYGEPQPIITEVQKLPTTNKWQTSDLLQVPSQKKVSQEPQHFSFHPDNEKKQQGNKMSFDNPVGQEDDGDNMSFGSKKSIEQMSAGQLEVFSVQLNKERYAVLDKLHAYACFTMLILLSIANTMQRSAISYMYSFEKVKANESASHSEFHDLDPFYTIRSDIPEFTPERYNYLAGDPFTIIYAFMVLFSGSASDLLNRKTLICATAFGYTLSIYLSSFATDFTQLFALRLVFGLLNAVSGPCSYSLITDWIPPESRTMAYSIYALGTQFGGPISSLNSSIIDWLGWRATFQFLALIGFMLLALAVLIFDEPERGRYDINQSVINNPDESYRSDNKFNELSMQPTRKRLDIQQTSPNSNRCDVLKEYCMALRELFVNDTANWILLASVLRTQQGIVMGLYTQQFFMIYPDNYELFNTLSTVAGLVGAFVCTMGTAVISDRYDNYNYMTKAYMCIYTTLISIPCCSMTYLCTSNFYVSMTGLFIEYMLSTGWGQPAIGILSTVCDPHVRGTAVSIFFFLLTMYGVVAPMAFNSIQNHYGLDPLEEPQEFGMFVAVCTVLPCILSIPCFYIAGVKYSWYKYHEAMFMLDVWNEMEQWYADDVSKKRFTQMQMNGGPAPDDPANLSVSVDWKLVRQQRKLKIKNLKNDQVNLMDIKPTMVHKRGGGPLGIQKPVIANLKEDETLNEFPDTRSEVDEQSYVFQKAAQSYDARKHYLFNE